VQKIKENEKLTQDEMIHRFYDYIENFGVTYSKSQKIYARPGIVGERIDTMVDSGIETSVIVQENKVVIRNQTKAQEEYVVGKEKFEFRYRINEDTVPDELSVLGYKCYTPVGQVKGVVASDLFETGVDEIYFTASWNELMKCQKEDIVAIPIGTKKEVYRIAISEFYQTYK
jgi:hypothetical protein